MCGFYFSLFSDTTIPPTQKQIKNKISLPENENNGNRVRNTHRTGMDSNSNGSAGRVVGLKTEVGMSGLALDQSSSSGRSTPTDLPHNKLFVGGLSWQTSADKLREYFGQYGTIIDVQVLKDPLTQVGRLSCLLCSLSFLVSLLFQVTLTGRTS